MLTSPLTLKWTLALALVPTLVLLLAAFALVAPGVLNTTWVQGTDAEVMQIREGAEGAPSTVLAENAGDCWRGAEEPKAALPGSIIWQRPDGRAVRTSSAHKVDAAFNEAIGGADAPFRWVALCV